MQNVEPLESWGMNKSRFGQLGADGAAFVFKGLDGIVNGRPDTFSFPLMV
jgi:hypothetical protein